MIPQEMIRKMAKPYTDKQVGGKDPFVKVGTGWWSNGIIALFEDVPATLADDAQDVPEPIDLEAWGWTQADSRPIWPVVMWDRGAQVWVQFTDGNGTKVFANARYISAILKRDKLVGWYFNSEWSAEGQIIARSPDGKPVALLMPLRDEDGNEIEPTSEYWQIANHDLNAPKSLALARKVDALLPKGKRGNDWQAVTVNGRDVEARRQVNAGLAWKEGKVGKAAPHPRSGRAGVSLLPPLVSKRTKRQVKICIRQGGQWAEIDLYDGHTRTGAA